MVDEKEQSETPADKKPEPEIVNLKIKGVSTKIVRALTPEEQIALRSKLNFLTKSAKQRKRGPRAKGKKALRQLSINANRWVRR